MKFRRQHSLRTKQLMLLAMFWLDVLRALKGAREQFKRQYH